MTDIRTELTNKGWIGKAAAGAILGFTLAMGLAGIFAWAGPDGLVADSGKMQLTMWITAPVWATVLSLCFLYQSWLRAWIWLGLLNIIVFAGLLALQTPAS